MMIKAREAAKIMGISRQRVHQLIQDGRFPGAVQVDGPNGRKCWMLDDDEVMAHRPKKQGLKKKVSWFGEPYTALYQGEPVVRMQACTISYNTGDPV